MKSRRRFQLGWLVSCAFVIMAQASGASAQTIITSNNETYACSELLQGDNEFWGSGPITIIRADLMLNAAANGVGIHVQMLQVEAGGDSVGYARTVIPLAQVPAGTRITHISTPGPQGWVWTPLTPGQVTLTQSFNYTDTNTSRDTMSNLPWWLESVSVDGDRVGPDLFTNCSWNPDAHLGSGIHVKPQKLTLLAQ